ncbi:transposase [Azotobacter beijerinckii]|uniref:transposase n=1 Tax=Azotobacter beijerinckii TaxID=170623 RepID=UPI0037C00BAB
MPVSVASPGGYGRPGAESKVPFVAAVSLSNDGRPLRSQLMPVPGFSLKAIEQWARSCRVPGYTVPCGGLACFTAVTAAGCLPQRTVIAGHKPRDLPEFQWVNSVLGNLETHLAGRYPVFSFRK